MSNVLYSIGESEIEEKRSRFFGYCAPAATEAEARAVIKAAKELRSDANHHVFAYDIFGEGGRFTRQSDDGEPHGTAGMPVLFVFTKQEIMNFVCVVTRIFGGTLLGKGGLVRAYTAAAKEALAAAGFGPLIIRTRYAVTIPYGDWDRINYAFGKNGIPVDETDFGAVCTATVTVMEQQEEVFRKIIDRLECMRIEKGEA